MLTATGADCCARRGADRPGACCDAKEGADKTAERTVEMMGRATRIRPPEKRSTGPFGRNPVKRGRVYESGPIRRSDCRMAGACTGRYVAGQHRECCRDVDRALTRVKCETSAER